ncbi:DHS-like NAD/FAD-binding domain-containing protein [Agrocybe pediades]|nr:DHS-like NAD/FAD-binding domain-containing protein [Agrocybe pediades]
MTIFLPLDPSSQVPSVPSFLVPPLNPVSQLSKTIQAIMKAKRIVVICGAGISVQAGIPDFRSSEGLFQTIKRDNPKEAMTSGKELFDVSVFNSEQKTALFCQMIAQLSNLSREAEPTSFHNVLRSLDDRGKLLRVYTQNIDAIEEKSGLSFGVPEFDDKRYRTRSKGKAKAVEETVIAEDNGPVASTSRLPSPPAETPRCIPLHGTLQSMHCQICNHSFPLLDYLPSLSSGQPPPCPECTSIEATRQLVGKRPRGIGKLRPSVVLYNEAHKDGEGVGDVVQKDLIGSSKGKGRSGADLLLVVGTSLRVPGTKRMVREFAKAVRSRGSGSTSSKDENTSTPTSSSGLATPAPSPRRTPTAEEEIMPKAVYLNLDFPVPTREWEGVFDAWIQGDAQEFAEVLQAEIEKESKAKEIAVKKKQKKDEEVAAQTYGKASDKLNGQNSAKRKQKISAVAEPTILSHAMRTPSGKRRKVTLPPSPPFTPPSPQRRGPSLPPEDIDQDGIIDMEASPRPCKLLVRIPARPAKPYYVPEVYIRSKAPHYVRPRQFSFSTPPNESYIRTRTMSSSPKPQSSDQSSESSSSLSSFRQSKKKNRTAPSSTSSTSSNLGGDNQGHHRHHRQHSSGSGSVILSTPHSPNNQQQHHRTSSYTHGCSSHHSLPSSHPAYGYKRARSGSGSSTGSNSSHLGGRIDHGHLSRAHQLGLSNHT